jgi:hypothetical protein
VELRRGPPFGNGAARIVAVSDNAYQIDAHPFARGDVVDAPPNRDQRLALG